MPVTLVHLSIDGGHLLREVPPQRRHGGVPRRGAAVGSSKPGFGGWRLADLVGEINAEVSAEGPDARRPRLAETLSDANAVVAL
jgi:hypothetical protein